ncbi:MAG: ATP-binding protein [Saprospiraceae bacterium]
MEKTSPDHNREQWSNRLFHLPGDDEEVMLSKKIWFSIVVFTIGLAVILIVAWWLLANFPNALNLVFFVLTLITSILTLFFFVRIFTRERMRFKQVEAEKLRSLDAAKSHFFANISHEFRTPLTVIMGMADQLPGESSHMIWRNSKKLLRLVDQLLDLSKLEAGSLPTRYVQADVVGEMKYILESYHSLAASKHIHLGFSSDRDELWMDIDTEKLDNIVGNLVDNAIKYSLEDGDVILSLKMLHADRLLIRVEDNGIGIPPEHLDKIFNRFYRVGEWPVEGAGIGLAIVHEYVKLLDGKMEVESRQGWGTAFSITLPIKQTAPRMAAQPRPGSLETGKAGRPNISVLGKPQLLIIEDSPDVVHYLDNLLHGQYLLSIAQDGEEGLFAAIEQVPDIIISDIMMPKKDGIEVCKTLKNDIRTNHIPIILLTARVDIASRISGLEAGADACLAKPFKRQELEVELAKLLRMRELLRQKYQHPGSVGAIAKPQGLNERFLKDVHACLEKHYQEETFGIQSLHDMLGLSRTQLHRKLAALTGKPASHFIRSFRLEKAKHLLQTTRMTVAEVAYAVGFKDAMYFSRAFSHEFGMPPSEARG